MEKNIYFFYTGDEVVSKFTIMSIVDFSSDFTFNYPTVRSVNRYLEYGCVCIFLCIFLQRRPKFGMNIKPNLYNVSQEGASHRDELGYLFHRLNKYDELTNEVQAMIDSITT